MRKNAKSDRLFATTWVHVFEEDTAHGRVYRPEENDIPLSRRPRERIQLRADGTAKVFIAAPDDGHVAQAATWQKRGDANPSRTRSGQRQLQIVEQSPERLIIR